MSIVETSECHHINIFIIGFDQIEEFVPMPLGQIWKMFLSLLIVMFRPICVTNVRITLLDVTFVVTTCYALTFINF